MILICRKWTGSEKILIIGGPKMLCYIHVLSGYILLSITEVQIPEGKIL